jgi:hypothetical protein
MGWGDVWSRIDSIEQGSVREAMCGGGAREGDCPWER